MSDLQACKLREVVEVCIAIGEDELVLKRERSDPKVVGRDRFSLLPQIRVGHRGGLTRAFPCAFLRAPL